jgi:exodeoxyribonuclease VII small subunit
VGQGELEWEGAEAPESFEDALKRLEEIVAKLETGGATLDESVAAFKQGIELVKYCSLKLDAAEQSVKQLVEEEGGGFRLEPFQAPKDNAGTGD